MHIQRSFVNSSNSACGVNDFIFFSSSNYVLTDEQSLWIEDTTKAVYQVGTVGTSIKHLHGQSNSLM